MLLVPFKVIYLGGKRYVQDMPNGILTTQWTLFILINLCVEITLDYQKFSNSELNPHNI